jgi:putative endonuclease
MKIEGWRGKRRPFSIGGKMYFVYVLRSAVTGRLYTGSTADVQDRLRRHNSGESKATRHGIPWLLVHTETFATRAEAVRRERYYKTGRGREELETLLGTQP